MGHFLLPQNESVWMLRVWSLEDHWNGYSVRVLGFVNGFKQALYKRKNYRGFPLKGKLVGGWAGQSSIEDLSQNLVPESNWMLFSLLGSCFSSLPISHGYLYAEADSTAVKKVPLKSVSSPSCLRKIYAVVFQDSHGEGGRVVSTGEVPPCPLLFR